MEQEMGNSPLFPFPKYSTLVSSTPFFVQLHHKNYEFDQLKQEIRELKILGRHIKEENESLNLTREKTRKENQVLIY